MGLFIFDLINDLNLPSQMKEKSISGLSPLTISAIADPEPQAKVQPNVPWPEFKYKLPNFVRPTIGTLDGVIGLKPAHFLACS